MSPQDLQKIDQLLQKRFKSFAKNELQAELNRFATKEDLKNELQKYATKEDLKNELQAELKRFATKEDVENIIGDATSTVLEAIDDRKADRIDVLDHERRITILENKTS